ncbi:MAG: tyrosine-type recombinase/integrase [Clostridia bacterium]|nr:tyrosine-type recombinase/integrase [Clostridia bacterium]
MGKDLNGKDLGKGIVQKKNGIYEARFNNRFGKRVSVTGRDLKDVKKRYNEAIYEDEKEINIRDNIKLDDWYDKWMNVYKFDIIRENTRRHYNHVYKKHISPTLGKISIQNITQLQIRELIKDLKKQGYQFETRNKVKVLLVDIFNKAMIDEFVRKNPAKGISVPKDKDKEVQVLTLEDQIDFFNCCKGTFYDNFFTVAIQTGMRIGELAALRWEDIDWDKNIIRVTRTLVYQRYEEDSKKTFHFEEPKTKTSYREIPISKQCAIALKKQFMQKRILENKAPESKRPEKEFRDLLFTTKVNTPLNPQNICDAIKRIVNEINLMRDTSDELETFSCHCFRHTFATRCFEAGIKPKTVQSYLGHASLKMTMDLYTSVLPEHMSSEMGKLDSEFEKINNEGFENELTEQKYNSAFQTYKKVVNFGEYLGYVK